MLQISHLYKNYGKFQAVRDLNLHVPKGDLFGFVGPNGAGKTTTIRMVCGLMPPTEGTITIHGVDALQHPKEIKKQIGYVPDFFGVYDNLKVSEYMDFYGSMYRMTSRRSPRYPMICSSWSICQTKKRFMWIRFPAE